MIAGAIVAISAQAIMPLHVIIVVGLFLLMLQGPKGGFFWATIAGLLYETVSPFPPFVFLAALFSALSICAFILGKYVSHRTFFGAVVIGAIGGTLYELFTFLFSRVGKMLGDGWAPVFDAHYIKFVFIRALASALALGLLTLVAKRASPGIRGVMITH